MLIFWNEDSTRPDIERRLKSLDRPLLINEASVFGEPANIRRTCVDGTVPRHHLEWLRLRESAMEIQALIHQECGLPRVRSDGRGKNEA